MKGFTRRDFVNGALVGSGAALLPTGNALAQVFAAEAQRSGWDAARWGEACFEGRKAVIVGAPPARDRYIGRPHGGHPN